jgi:hypothetical protein
MVLTHAEWIAGVVLLGSWALLAVNRAVRRHVAGRSANQS